MRLPRGDWPLLVASLALGAVLWLLITGRQTAERGVSVPVELRNVPRDLEVTGDALNSIDVRLRASPGVMDSLEPGRVLATIDLRDAHEGEAIVQLSPEMIRVPFGFRVVKIAPAILTLNLEASERKTVPVRPRVIGRPAEGFEVAAVTSDPAEVRVAGPRSRVQEIESAYTEPVSVDGARDTAEQLVNVGLEDPLLRLEGGSRVRVRAAIREAHETRVFAGLPVVARGRPARLDPSRVAVVVSGPASRVRALEEAALRPFVQVPESGPVAARLPLSVELEPGHEGLSVVETRPADVGVRPLSPGRAPRPR